MNIFEAIQDNIIEVFNNLDKIIVESMVAEKEAIIDLNVSQLEKGLNPDGELMGDYSTDEYSQLKKSIGSKAPYGKVDTKLTGAFHEGFYAEADYGTTLESSGLFINSHDDKADKLDKDYHTFGVMPGNVQELEELTMDDIQKGVIDGITKI